MTLTDLERALFEGGPDALERFEEQEKTLVVDWRGTEEEALTAIRTALPEEQFAFEITEGPGTLLIRAAFRGREVQVEYEYVPLNNVRVILQAAGVLSPDYEIRGLRETARDDTNVLIAKPSDWWSHVDQQYPKITKKTFCRLDEMRKYWGLESADQPTASGGTNPWWKFWR